MVPDPDGPVMSSEYRLDFLCSKPLTYRETNNWNVAETIDTLGRGHPQVTFPVFEKSPAGIARQAVCTRKPIQVAIVKPIDPGVISRNPQCVVAIQMHAVNPQRAAVECRRDQCSPGTVHPLLQAQSVARPGDPHPHRSIRSEGHV